MTIEEMNNMPLTYDFLALNFEEDKETPHLNVYPTGIYRTDKYFIGAELTGSCDCVKHLTVVNCENKFESTIRDSEKNLIKQHRKFTVGDLYNLLNLVGFNDIADNLKYDR